MVIEIRVCVVRAPQALMSVHADAQELKSPASQSSRRAALAYSQVEPPEPLAAPRVTRQLTRSWSRRGADTCTRRG